jgi:hypothetical protein
MIGIRIGRAERDREGSVRWGGGVGRYAIVGGPGVLLIVEDLTEAARRQWPRKNVFLTAGSGILFEAMRRRRGRPSELNGSAAAVCNYPGWIARTPPWIKSTKISMEAG